jgi:hypothetical protein
LRDHDGRVGKKGNGYGQGKRPSFAGMDAQYRLRLRASTVIPPPL